MKKVKVSIIVPVYNEEDKIERCINSLVSQSLKEIEIIIVDDGSTDNTYNICGEMYNKDKRIKLFKKNNEGQGIARNFGLKYAIGEFVTFVDSDDYVDFDMYEKMYESSIKNNSDGCFCISPNYQKDFLVNNNKDSIDNFIICDIIGNTFDEKAGTHIGCSVCNKLYRLSLIKDNNILFKSERIYFSEDMIFNLDFLKECTNITTINHLFYHYEQNENSYTHTYKKDYLEKSIKQFEYLENYTKGNNYLWEERFFNIMLLELILIIRQEVIYNKIKFRTKISNIKKICNNIHVKKIINSINFSKKLTIKKKIFLHLIKSKNAILLYLVFKIKR